MAPPTPINEFADPLTLMLAARAFDAAWLEIGGNYPLAIAERAHERLARIVLAQPLDEKTDVGTLKQAAIETMAVGERMPILRRVWNHTEPSSTAGLLHAAAGTSPCPPAMLSRPRSPLSARGRGCHPATRCRAPKSPRMLIYINKLDRRLRDPFSYEILFTRPQLHR